MPIARRAAELGRHEMNMGRNDSILFKLKSAIDRKDPDGVEDALNEAFIAGLTPDLVPALVDLLGMPWHFRHEDVVSALQKLKPPQAVNALCEAALAIHEYLDYDEFFGLARKRTWVLADIGTPEARRPCSHLRKLPMK